MFDIKKGMEKKKCTFTKLIQFPWSIKTVISQFNVTLFLRVLDLPGYDTSHPIAHTDRKEGGRWLNIIFSRRILYTADVSLLWSCLHVFYTCWQVLVFPLRHCLLLAPDRLLRENHKRAQENHSQIFCPRHRFSLFRPSIPHFSSPGFYIEIQYAALLQQFVVCWICFTIAHCEFVSAAACVITPPPRLH